MTLIPEFFPDATGFEWDEGNSTKNWLRHKVTQAEAEQVFLNRPITIAESSKRVGKEIRHFALGRTNLDRQLTVVFTIRGPKLRIISARPMSRKERQVYAQTQT